MTKEPSYNQIWPVPVFLALGVSGLLAFGLAAKSLAEVKKRSHVAIWK